MSVQINAYAFMYINKSQNCYFSLAISPLRVLKACGVIPK